MTSTRATCRKVPENPSRCFQLMESLNTLNTKRSPSLVIGFFWGLWHLPLIAAGYNYPGHPVAGPIVLGHLSHFGLGMFSPGEPDGQ